LWYLHLLGSASIFLRLVSEEKCNRADCEMRCEVNLWSAFFSHYVNEFYFLAVGALDYTFLNKWVRYAIQSATAMYPIIVMKLAIVEATNGS
jgi:hypothetical protein